MRYLVKLVIRTRCLDTVECCFGSSVLCASLLYVSIYFIIFYISELRVKHSINCCIKLIFMLCFSISVVVNI